jgi:hypothetical protein
LKNKIEIITLADEIAKKEAELKKEFEKYEKKIKYKN